MTSSPTEAAHPLVELPSGVTRGHVPRPRAERSASGNAALDTLLGGGFPRGGLSEIFGPPSSGRTSLVYSLLRSVTGRGEAAALVDHADRFDSPHADRAGIHLFRLLWIRPRAPREALRCAEILLGTRGFGLVVVDLADGFAEALAARSDSAWARLAHRAASSRAALVLLSERRLSGSFAHLCVSLSDARPLWPKHRLGPPLFAGFEARAEIVRSKEGSPGSGTHLRFDDEATTPASDGRHAG